MNPSKIFIERPVMTTLLMAALVIFGAFGYTQLPISDLPNMDLPTINVGASLPGADPTTMASAVAAPLEAAFTQIAGVESMTSSSTQGQTQVALQFNLDRNIDGAAQDVQSAISTAARQMPRNMPAPPAYKKNNPSDQPQVFISFSSATLSNTQVDEYAETQLARQISTLEGVAQVNVFGSSKYAVRIQADPAALATRQIGIDTLVSAVATANVNQATGALNGVTRSSIIKADGQLNNAHDFAQQIITYRNGAPVRLGDVAKVIDGTENPYQVGLRAARRRVVLAVFKQSAPTSSRWMIASMHCCPNSGKRCRPASVWKWCSTAA